ncbi:MAG: hypothetical protein VKP62_16095 [Candidatus Sericytochromatia bacterium]|nr:hypothetical protein [Candidatus Sericytochromatia bacterium]
MTDPAQRSAEHQRLRASIEASERAAMAKFRQIIDETTFDLDPICVYVIMDKLRGTRNTAGIPEKAYKRAEQMLRVLGLSKYWGD